MKIIARIATVGAFVGALVLGSVGMANASEPEDTCKRATIVTFTGCDGNGGVVKPLPVQPVDSESPSVNRRFQNEDKSISIFEGYDEEGAAVWSEYIYVDNSNTFDNDGFYVVETDK